MVIIPVLIIVVATGVVSWLSLSGRWEDKDD